MAIFRCAHWIARSRHGKSTWEGSPIHRILIESSGLTALVHPLTDDDLADHTSLAQWIGTPLELDLTTLDPPGVNQGIARFSKTDF